MKHRLAALLVATMLLPLASPAPAQLGQSDCSLARDEIARDACYRNNAAAAARNSTSRVRIEQHVPSGAGSGETTPQPSPQEEEAMRYWHQKALEHQEEQRRWEQSEPYQRQQAERAAFKAHLQQQARRLFDATETDLRFAPPLQARMTDWNTYNNLTKDKAFAARIRALFPDIGTTIVEQNRGGYWDDRLWDKRWQKYQHCFVEGKPDGELLGLLATNDRYFRIGIFAYHCIDKTIYKLAPMTTTDLNANPFLIVEDDLARIISGSSPATR